MTTVTKRTRWLIVLLAAFIGGLAFMAYSFVSEGGLWVSNRANSHIYSKGELIVAGTIFDRNGESLVKTQDGKRVYNEDASVRRATLHVVGDSTGYISTGIQTLYRSNLIGYNLVDGIYNTLANESGADVTLTVDAELSAAAYKAMNGNKGTVTVYNYQTGEVIVMVSAPNYDPVNKPADIDTDTTGKYDGIYINRALTGVFTPGSTFKIVTAICAIENIPDIYERTFNCKGKVTCGSGEVICNGTHGKVSFERGLNVSCNCVFAELANELGSEKLTDTVRQLGFGKSVTVSKAQTVKTSFDVSKSTALDLGWAGIGQYTTLVNPTQMLLLMGAIANDGIAIEPYLVEESSELIDVKSKQSTNIELSPETAKAIKTLLRSNVENYYTDDRFPGLEMCGKTGSAEVVDEKSHAWFVGFSQKKDFPYAIVVCLENGGIGLNDAIPVANKTMQAVLAKEGK